MYKPKTEDMQGNQVDNERHPLMMQEKPAEMRTCH